MAKLLSGTRIYGTATVDTQLSVNGTATSTSTTTGALQVTGGAGIGGNLYVGGTIYGTVTTATNIAAGTAGQLVYQTGAGATSFVGPGTTGSILVSSGTNAPVYTNTSSIYVGRAVLADSVTTASNAVTSTNVTVASETATSTAHYLTFISVSTGSSVLKVATTGLSYIPSSSYVGMGIATPTAPLHIVNSVNSVVKFRGGTTGSIGIIYSDATQLAFVDSGLGNGFTILPLSSNVSIATNATEAIRVDSVQQVGINTNRPNYRLDVRGQTYIGAASTLSQLILGDTTNSTTATIATVNSDLIFSANGTAEALRITSSKGIAFGGSANYGSNGQLLKSAGNASPTWVDQSTIAAGSVTYSHTAGTGLSGSTYNGSAAVTWTLNTATLMTTAVTANNLAASATLGGSGYLYIGGYNTNPSTPIYPTPFTVNSTGPIAIADNFSGGNVEANIWNTVYPSSYAGTGIRFQQLLTTGTYRDLVFFKNTGAIAFGGISNFGSSGQLLQSNGDSTATWISLSGVTVGKANNLVGGTAGQIPYQIGPDTTSFMTNTNWNSSTSVLSVTGTVQATVFSRTGNFTATAWTTTSPVFNNAAAVLTDSSTLANTTVTSRTAVAFLAPTFAAANANITITDAANLYVGSPVPGTSITITNQWGIWNAGSSLVGGSEKIGTSLAVGSYSITANTGDILASGNGMFGYSTAQSGARLSANGGAYINGITTNTGALVVNSTLSPIGKATVYVPSTNIVTAWDNTSTAGLVIAGTGDKVRLQFGVGSSTLGAYAGWIQASYDNTSGNIGTEPLILNPIGGAVAIGTSTSAGYKLEVNGGAFIGGTLTATTLAGALAFSHTTGTGLTGLAYNGSAAVSWTLATAYGDSINPYASKTANYFLAAPNGAAGVPSFRAVVAADIPTLNQNTTGSAGSVANSLTAGNGLGGGTYNGSAAVSFTNNGVTSLSAGTNIAVSASTGAVTVSVTGTVGAATSAVYARALQQTDGPSFLVPVDPRGASGARGTDLAPNTYSQGLFSEFKNASLYTGVSGNYAGLLTYANWVGTSASTGDPSYSLLFSPQAANSTLPPRLQLRAGIDTTWGKWSDILHSGNHASAAGSWTPNFSGGVRGYANGSFKKDSGTNPSWDGQVYSSEGYSTRVYCSAKAGETNTHIMFGLNSDPTTDASYTSIDYAWYLNAGSIAIYESGASIYGSGTYSVNDVFTITYDGTNVRYYYNDTLIRTIARAVSGTLYFDSSFYEVPCSLTSVAFGSTGVGGATGASLTLASLGVGTPSVGTAGAVTAPILQLGRSNFAGSGISWYSSGYTAWSTYMAAASATTVGPTSNITAPSGTLVTSWALRNFVENAGGYGFTWESGTSTGQPTVVAEILASNGSFRSAGNITAAVSLGVGTAASGTTGEIRATNEITAYYSDRRLKTDVRSIDNAVDKVVSLNGIIYKSNDIAAKYGYNTTNDIVGLFADEVEAVLPQAVRPAPFDQDENGNSKSGENYKTIQYEKLVPLLVEAIKEQQQQIAQLQEMVNKLANK